MKRALLAVVLAFSFTLCVGAATAHAQSPAPESTTAETTAETTEGDTGDAKPWGRLAIFVPASIALGAGAVYGLRFARERGWTSS